MNKPGWYVVLGVLILGSAIFGWSVYAPKTDDGGCTIYKIVTATITVKKAPNPNDPALRIRSVELSDGHTYRYHRQGGDDPDLATSTKVGLCDVQSKVDGSHHFALRNDDDPRPAPEDADRTK